MKTNVLLVCVALLVAGLAMAQNNKPDGKSTKQSVAGPGTQTEDELYIGKQAQPKAATTSKQTTRNKRAKTPICDDTSDPLCDLEIERARAKAR